jgi:hypothetical protein
MSEVINAILSFLTGALSIAFLVVMFIANKKGELYTQKNTTFRTIASIVLLILFCFEVASDISLTKSVFIIGLNIFCTVFWAITLALNLNVLKKPKDKTTEESDKSKETENK